MNFKPISKSSVINANGINRATNVAKITNSLVINLPTKSHELYHPGIKFGANSSENSFSPNKLLALARHQNGFDFYNSFCRKTKSGSSLNGRKASSTYKTAGKHRKFLCQYRNHNSNEDLIELLRKGFILGKIPYPIGAHFCEKTDDCGKQSPKSKTSKDDACQIKKERIRQLNIDVYNIKTNIDGLCKSKIKKDDPCKPKAELQKPIMEPIPCLSKLSDPRSKCTSLTDNTPFEIMGPCTSTPIATSNKLSNSCDPCTQDCSSEDPLESKRDCSVTLQQDSDCSAAMGKEDSTVKKTPNISLGKLSGTTKKQKLASKEQDSSAPSANDNQGSMNVGGDSSSNGHAAWKNTKCKKMDFSCPPKKSTPLTCLPKSNVCHDVSQALKAINEMQNDPCQQLKNNQKTPCKMIDGKIVCQIKNMCCVLEKYDSCNPKHKNIPEPKSGDMQFSCRIEDVFCVCTKIEKKSGQYVASSSDCSTKCKPPKKTPTVSKLPIKQSLAWMSPHEDFKMRMGGICDPICKRKDKGTVSVIVSGPSIHGKNASKDNISKEKVNMLSKINKLCNPFKKMKDVNIEQLEPKTTSISPSPCKDLTVSPLASKTPCEIVDDKIRSKIPDTDKELCIPQDSCMEITQSLKSFKAENISKPPISQEICKEDSSNTPCMSEKKSPCKVCENKVVCEFEDKTCVCKIYNPCKQEHRDPPKQKTGDKVSICRIGSLHCECSKRTNIFDGMKETCKSTKDACKPLNIVSCNGNNDKLQLRNCKIIEGKLVIELKNTCCVCEKFDPCNPEHANIPRPKSTDKIASCVIENMYCNCVNRSDIKIPKETRDVNVDCGPKDDKNFFFQAIFDKIKLEREARAKLINRTKNAPTLNCKDKTDTKISIELFAEICKKNKASSTECKVEPLTSPRSNPNCDMDMKDSTVKLNSKACGKVNWPIPVVKKTNPTCEQLSNAIIESMEIASKPQSKSKNDCEILAPIPVEEIKSPKVEQSTAKPLNLCNIAKSVETTDPCKLNDPCAPKKQKKRKINKTKMNDPCVPIKPKGIADSCILKVNSSLKEKNASSTSEKPASLINLHLKIKESKINQVSSGKDPKESIDIYVDVDFVNKTVALTPSLKSCEVPSNLKTSSKLSDPCISQEPCKPSFNCKEIKKEPNTPEHNTCMTKVQMTDLCKNAKPNLSHAKVNSCIPNMEPCIKLDPPKSKLDEPCVKVDPCNLKNISLKIELPTTNPCIVTLDSKSTKSDPCKTKVDPCPKIDPCKPTLKCEEKSACKTKNDPCATKNDESCEKVDPCISFKNIASKIEPPTSNSCIVTLDSKSTKSDPCKTKVDPCPKIDPCKPTLKCEEKSACKTQNDPCTTKNDESCEKVDPCISFKNISSKMEPPRSNPCIVTLHSKSTKSDPCKTKVDPCPKIDPCKPTLKCEEKSACKTQNDPCANKNNASCEKVDPCISFKNISTKMEPPTSNPCTVTLDSKSTKSDPCKTKIDPCPKIDPCKPTFKCEDKSACKTQNDPCANKNNASCEKVDPCISFKNISSKMEPPRSNPCIVTFDSKCTKSDPCKTKVDPCKPTLKCEEKSACKTKNDPCATKNDESCKKVDPCISFKNISSKMQPPRSNPCIVTFDSKCTKSDPCKTKVDPCPKIDPCKPTLKCEEKSACKTKNDPCATKNDESCKKVDPCISFKNISSKMQPPRSNPCIVTFDSKCTKSDPCKTKVDPCPKIDPCKPTLKCEDKIIQKTIDPCKKNTTGSARSIVDACKKNNDASAIKKDLCKLIKLRKVQDPCTQKPRVPIEDHIKPKVTLKNCKKADDPCELIIYESKKDSCELSLTSNENNTESCKKNAPKNSKGGTASDNLKFGPCNENVSKPKYCPRSKTSAKRDCKVSTISSNITGPCKQEPRVAIVDLIKSKAASNKDKKGANLCVSTKTDLCKPKQKKYKQDPCKFSTFSGENRSDPSGKKTPTKHPKNNLMNSISDPCLPAIDQSATKADPCKPKTDFSAPKENLCKPKLTSDSLDSKTDPCKPKTEFSAPKESLCKPKLTSDSLDSKTDPCTIKSDPSKPKTEFSAPKENLCEPKLTSDPCDIFADPCKPKTDFSAPKENLCKPKLTSDSLDSKTDPCKPKTEFSAPKKNLCKPKLTSDSLDSKTDPCKPKTEFAAPKENLCKPKLTSDSLDSKTDPCKPKTEFAAPKENLCKPKLTSDSLDSKTDPCKPKTEFSAPKESLCKPKLTSDSLDSTTDPCTIKSDPSKPKTEFSASKENLCEPKLTSDPCDIFANPCKPKTDFSAPKENLCKPKLTSDSLDCKTDPCKSKTKFSAPKENLCKPKLTSDSLDCKTDPCKSKTKFSAPKENLCKPKLTSDSLDCKTDPCKSKTKFSAPKENLCKPKLTSDSLDCKTDPCAANADPSKTEFSAPKENLCKPKVTSDSCDSKTDPCAIIADLYKPKTDFSAPKEYLCKPQLTSDPCAANADPCKSITDPCIDPGITCNVETNYSVMKEDPCKPKLELNECTPLNKVVTPDECTDQSQVVISDTSPSLTSMCTPLPESHKKKIEECKSSDNVCKTSTERESADQRLSVESCEQASETKMKEEGINLECQQLDAKENMISKYSSDVKPVKLHNTEEKSCNISEVACQQLDAKENMVSKYSSDVKPVKLHNTGEKSCNIDEVGCQQRDAKVNMIIKFSSEVKPVKLYKTAEKSEQVPNKAKVDPCKDKAAIRIKEMKQISENSKGGSEPDTCKYSSCNAKMPDTYKGILCIIPADTLHYPYPPLTPPKAVTKSKRNIIKSKPQDGNQCLEIKDPKLHNEEMIDPKATVSAPVMENNCNIKIEEPPASQIAVEDPREQIAQIAISKADKLKNSLMPPEENLCKKKDPCEGGKMEKIEMSEEMCRKLKGDADKKVCLYEVDECDKGVCNFVRKSPTTDKGGNNRKGTCSEDSCKDIMNVYNQPDCRPAPKHGQPPFKPDKCRPKHLTKEPETESDIIVFPAIPPLKTAECIPHTEVYPPPNMKPPFMNPPRPKTNMTCNIDESQVESLDQCYDKPSTTCCKEDSEPLQIKCNTPPDCSTIFDVTQHKQWCAVPVKGEPQIAGGRTCAQYIERNQGTDEITTTVLPNLATALISPRFDVALPQSKEKEKDMVSGTKGLLQTICKVFCPKKKGDGKSEATGYTKQNALCEKVQPKAGCTLLPECGSEEDREALKAKTLKQWPFLEQRHHEGPNLLRGCQTMIDKQTYMANQRKCKPNPIDAPEDNPAQSRISQANKNSKWRKC